MNIHNLCIRASKALACLRIYWAFATRGCDKHQNLVHRYIGRSIYLDDTKHYTFGSEKNRHQHVLNNIHARSTINFHIMVYCFKQIDLFPVINSLDSI